MTFELLLERKRDGRNKNKVLKEKYTSALVPTNEEQILLIALMQHIDKLSRRVYSRNIYRISYLDNVLSFASPSPSRFLHRGNYTAITRDHLRRDTLTSTCFPPAEIFQASSIVIASPIYPTLLPDSRRKFRYSRRTGVSSPPLRRR